MGRLRRGGPRGQDPTPFWKHPKILSKRGGRVSGIHVHEYIILLVFKSGMDPYFLDSVNTPVVNNLIIEGLRGIISKHI